MSIDHKKIFELKMEINRMLEEKPQYKPFQEKIDNIIKNSGNRHNSLVLLTEMMRDNIELLKEKLKELHVAMLKLSKELKKDETE